MSFADLDDQSSGTIDAASIALAAMGIPLGFLAAVLAVVVWGEFSGAGLVNRALCISSPFYIFAFVSLARRRNRAGDRKKAWLLLLLGSIPLLLLAALVIASFL